MDVQTLAIVTCLCAAWMAVTMGALYAASPRDRSLLDWATTGALFFVNGLVVALLLVGRFKGNLVVIGIANACVVMGDLYLLLGYREYLGQPSTRWPVALLGGLVWGAHQIPGWLDNVGVRIQLLLSLYILVDLAAVVLIARAPGFRWRSPSTLLLAVFLVTVLQRSGWLAALVLNQVGALPPLARDYGQVFGRFSLLLLLLGATMACTLLVLRKKELELKRSADLDPLTGWLNRRSIDELLGGEFSRARRGDTGFHLLTFDIDRFKSINDRFGHAVGDLALRHVTQVVSAELRGYDKRFRLGGEEFLVFAPSEQAGPLAERLRKAVESSPFFQAGEPLKITVSVGVGSALEHDDGWADVLNRADLALYEAKRGGRNMVVAA